MKNTKTDKVIMLPTEKASNLYIETMDELVHLKESFKCKDTSNQHLYVISDDEIKEGDWYYTGGKTSTFHIHQCTSERLVDIIKKQQNVYEQYVAKVVATTDKSLIVEKYIYGKEHDDKTHPMPIPQIPESFIQVYIKAYNEGKQITEVDLEMNINVGNNACRWIKTRPDNTVIIHQSKMYSRDEVIHLINRMYSLLTTDSNYSGTFLDKWYEENL